MPADWITSDDVKVWLGPMVDAERLDAATRAAKAYVEGRRSDLELLDDATVPPDDVKEGTALYASLVYQAAASPSGFAAYADGIDIPGDNALAYQRALRLIGSRRPIAL
jgi:hypothetical protein